MVEEVEYLDQIFIGAIDYNMTEDEFKEDIKEWGHITKYYYRGPCTGWATATFATVEERNKFLAKKRFVLGNKIVDVKPFKRPKYKQAPPTTTTSVSTVPVSKQVSKPTPGPPPGIATIISNPKPSTQSAPTAMTGVILRYTSPNFGVIRTNNHGNGILCGDVVYLCSNPDHNLACKTSECPTYTKLISHRRPKKSLFAALPIGTQISFFSRDLEIEDYNFQATVAWPQLSKKPSGAGSNALPSTGVLDEQLRQFLSGEDSRSELVAPVSTTPATSSASYFGGASAMSKNDDYLIDDSEILDDADLDIALDHLNRIQTFLRVLQIDTEGLCLTPLIDKLLAIKQEEEAVDEVMSFFAQNGAPIDDSRKQNLVANYRTLLHSLKLGSENPSPNGLAPTPPLPSTDESSLVETFCQFLIRETKKEYFKFINDKATVEKHCRAVVEVWKHKGFTLSRLLSEYRESQANGNLPFMEARWRREIESGSTHNSPPCLIEPLKIYELTVQFFRMYNSITANGNSITRSSSRGSIATPSLPKPTTAPPVTTNNQGDTGNRRPMILHEIQKLTLPSDPLKSHAAQFKLVGMIDGALAEECEKLLEDDTDLKNFSQLATWLRSNCPTSNFDNEITFVFSVVKTWSETEKSLADIKDVFRRHLSEPKLLLANWAHLVKPTSGDLISTDAILKVTFDYCLESVISTQKFSSLANVKSLFHNIQYFEPNLSEQETIGLSSHSAYFNLRGFIVHNFNEDYGVILTPVGRVVFDRNVAFCFKDSTWKRCKSKDMMLPPFTPVKLHARVHRLRWQRRNQIDLSILYAIKVWTWTEIAEEPYSGTYQLGKELYWTLCLKEFENLARANSFLLCTSSEKSKYLEDYRSTFAAFLKRRSLAAVNEVTNLELDNSGYESFRSFLSSQVSDYNELEKNYITSIHSFSRSASFLNFHELRKQYMVHYLLDNVEKFEELCETKMIFSPESSTYQVDIVPLLFRFFQSQDKVTEAQILEQKKIITRNLKGSPAQMEDILSVVSILLELKPYSAPEPQISGTRNKISSNGVPADSIVAVSAVEFQTLQRDHFELRNAFLNRIRLEEEREMKYQETLSAVFAQIEMMKSSIAEMGQMIKSNTSSTENSKPEAAPTAVKAKKTCFVKVSLQGSEEIHEFPTDENGNLQVESVVAVYHGITALKYTSETGNIRICRKIGDIFEPPEHGWEDKVYFANITPVNQPTFGRPNPGGIPFQAPGPYAGYPYPGLHAGNLIRPNLVPTSLGVGPFFPTSM